MIRIGNFSKLSQISIRMLRHYDDIGLLKPQAVDSSSGYRYYSTDQLAIAHRIVMLRDMGFNLASIAEILRQYHDADALRTLLAVKLEEIKEQEQQARAQITLIETTMNSLRGEDNMQYDVTLKTIPKRHVASLRRVVANYEDEGALWEELMEILGEDIQLSDPSLPLAVYHDESYKESDIDVEIQISVAGEQGTYKNIGDVIFKTVEPIQAASAVYKGSYDQSYAAHGAVAKWVAANCCEYAGPMINILHVSPDTESNPDKWVTEVCCPVKETCCPAEEK